MAKYKKRRDPAVALGCAVVGFYWLIGLAWIGFLIWAIARIVLHFT